MKYAVNGSVATRPDPGGITFPSAYAGWSGLPKYVTCFGSATNVTTLNARTTQNVAMTILFAAVLVDVAST